MLMAPPTQKYGPIGNVRSTISTLFISSAPHLEFLGREIVTILYHFVLQLLLKFLSNSLFLYEENYSEFQFKVRHNFIRLYNLEMFLTHTRLLFKRIDSSLDKYRKVLPHPRCSLHLDSKIHCVRLFVFSIKKKGISYKIRKNADAEWCKVGWIFQKTFQYQKSVFSRPPVKSK